ncbi:beta-ketoacyl synthase N-terminal-like domain-containing protein [Embleya sp. NPDC008237]|uniref:beta-ketoacyl synthase N-terminal-like domain-containing protein n=1 Tax=Embleya sp. NPDC008237 TaxID=3363978 RepID=UPI0036EF6BEB
MSHPDPATPSAIAVVGLACRFPGAPDADAYWDLLLGAREGLTRFTPDELADRGVPAELLRRPGYVPVGAVIDGQELFDPDLFGMTEAEGALADPQQRLFLECCRQALDDAGHGEGADAGVVGVYAGSAHSAYLAHNLRDRHDPTGAGADPIGSLQAAMAGVADYLPLHVAHRLGLTGPALAINTTCSTSLVAVHVAAQALLAGECDTALAGGVSLIVPQGRGYLHVPDAMFSADGRVRPFSARGTGIVHSQGVGAVVLRRLEDAVAAGDRVLAVLLGSAVDNDGADRVGFTAPSPRGQARAVAEALAVAGLEPTEIGYIEAHGTATPLGDAVEVAALRKVFGASGPAWCALGSVKGNIGHTNSAAGIAGFVKAVLAVHHGVIPASLHCDPVNPALDLADSPFTLADATRPWPGVRHAGVSAFGIGGTNCHIVLGQAPPRTASAPDPRPQLLLLSAHSAAALPTAVEALADVLTACGESADRAEVAAAPADSAARAEDLAGLGEPAARVEVLAASAVPAGRAEFAADLAEPPDRAEDSAETADPVGGAGFPACPEDRTGVPTGRPTGPTGPSGPPDPADHADCAGVQTDPADPARRAGVRTGPAGLAEPHALADIAATLHSGRPALRHRVAAVGTDHAGAAAALRAATGREVEPTAPRLILAFPGGGAQYAGMGAELYRSEPEFAAAIDACTAHFADPVRDLLLTHPRGSAAADAARDPRVGLPALFTVSVATARLLRSWGIEPDVVLGHSLGEYAAAVTAGILSLKDAAELVTVRCTGMAAAAGAGAMLAVQLSEAEARHLTRRHPQLDLAVVNAPDACVLAGPTDAILALQHELRARGVDATRLRLDAAAHSRLVDPVLADLRAAARRVHPAPGTIALVTSVTGEELRAEERADPEHWVRHLRSTVLFSRALRTAVGRQPSILLQAGPGSELALAARRQQPPALLAALVGFGAAGEGTERAALLSAAGRLWTHGIDLDARALHRPGRRRVVLPGHPTRRRRLWIEPASAERPPLHRDLLLQIPVWHESAPPVAAMLNGERWIVADHTSATTSPPEQEERARPEHPAHAVRRALEAAGAETATIDDERPCTGAVFVHDAAPVADGSEAAVAAAVAAFARFAAGLADRADAPTRLIVLTRNGERVEHTDAFDPAAAAIRALPRVLAQETPGLRWRALDLGAHDPMHALAREAADLRTGDNAREVAVRGRTRRVRSFAAWHPTDRTPAIDPGDTIVILGGLGDVGFTLAEHLTRTHRARVVLTSRTGIPNPEEATPRPDSAPEPITVDRSAATRSASVRAASNDAEPDRSPSDRTVSDRTAADHPAPHRELSAGGATLNRTASDGTESHGVARARTVPDRSGSDRSGSGRTGSDRSAPDGSAPERTAAGRRAWLDHLRLRGLCVEIAVCDAADPAAVHGLLHDLGERHGRPRLVVHAAGVVASAGIAPLRASDPATIAAHVRAKVGAADALRIALGELPEALRPPTVLAMSSATAAVGGLGLGPYAAANRALEAISARHSDDHTTWLCAAWDGWRVGPAGRERVVAAAHSLGAEDGTRALDLLLAAAADDTAPSVVAVSPADLAARLRHDATPAPTVAPTAVPTPADPSPDACDSDRRTDPRAHAMAAIWSDLLGFAVADPDADFFALGGHSLLATRMLARVHDAFGVRLRLSDLLDHPTAAGLAHLLDRTESNSTTRPEPPEPSASHAPVVAGDGAPHTEPLRSVPSPASGDLPPGSEPLRSAPSPASGDLPPRAEGPRPDASLAARDLSTVPEPFRSAASPVVRDFPLTRVQHAYWVGGGGGYRHGGTACHFFLEHHCPDLDVHRYQEALNRVIARHPMLRAVITPEGRNRILDRVPRYRIRVHDLTRLDPAERDAELVELRARLSHRAPRPDRWPLFEVTAARLSDGAIRLFTGFDVLVCDTASYLLVDREIKHFHDHPHDELPLPGLDFATCAAALEARRSGPAFDAAAEFWRARLADLPGPPALAHTTGTTTEQPPRFVRRSARLAPDTWRRLRDAAARRRLTPTAVLLAAYTETLAHWSGSDRFCVNLTLFDRPAIHRDVDRVVGDFTTLLLHESRHPTPTPTFAARAATTQRRLFADLDHRDFGALDVLAEQAARTGRLHAAPVVFTSALGLADVLDGGHDLDWVGTPVHGVSQTPQVWLDHQAFEQGGALLLQWDAAETILEPADVDAAFTRYVATVRRLADDPRAWGGQLDSDGVATTLDGVEDPDDVALLLRAGAHPRPLFLIHPSGGDVLCYGELARRLTTDRPVIGLTDPQLVGAKAPVDAEALVERHLRAIRFRQPCGPYALGGWSMGGILAHEIAGRLHAAGERVELLVLLDANLPDHIRTFPEEADQTRDTEPTLRYLASLEAFLDLDLDLDSNLDRADPDPAGSDAGFTALPPAERIPEATRRLRAAGLLGARDTAAERIEVFTRHLRLLGLHTAHPLKDAGTDTLIVRAGQRSPRNSGTGMGVDDVPGGTDLGWTPFLSTPPRCVDVDAHHYALLREPALGHLVALVDRALRDLPAAAEPDAAAERPRS